MLFKLVLLILVILFVSNSYGAKRVKRIVGGISAAPPPFDDPVVFVRLYSRNARIEGFRNAYSGHYSFLGIRYAEPPIGEDRFLRPRYRRLQGDINATRFGAPCPQPDPNNYGRVVGNEDCLTLNVFTPQMPDETTGLPVLVWIHGGGFRFGSSNQYGPEPLINKRIIFVPIQYRLGSLGIIGDGTTEFSGNVALFDMAAAVRWVNEYIEFFGGDPKKITVGGHGSGATSATQLTMSPVPREMISGVVAMSGSPYTKYAVDEKPMQSVKEIAMINECSEFNETEIIKCMRNKDFKDIVLNDSKVQVERLQNAAIIKSMTGMAGFGPVIENPDDNRGLPGFLDEKPETKMKKGLFRNVPLLTGVVKDETTNAFLLNDIKKSFKSATDFLTTVSKNIQIDGILKQSNQPTKIDLPGIGKILSLADYLKIPDSLDPEKIITKITEATTDILFNLPALLTAQTWSKVAPSFLYSFEWSSGKSKTNKKSPFLQGLPMVSQKEANSDGKENANITNKVGHGDELEYLFDVRDLHGVEQSSEKFQNKSSEDSKVRDTFTQLMANFLESTAANGSTAQQNNLFSLKSAFKPDGSSFIKIGLEAKMENDFRFCQLSLMGATIKSVQTESCGFLVDQLKSLTSILTNNGLSSSAGLGQLINAGSMLNTTSPNGPKTFGFF